MKTERTTFQDVARTLMIVASAIQLLALIAVSLDWQNGIVVGVKEPLISILDTIQTIIDSLAKIFSVSGQHVNLIMQVLSVLITIYSVFRVFQKSPGTSPSEPPASFEVSDTIDLPEAPAPKGERFFNIDLGRQLFAGLVVAILAPIIIAISALIWKTITGA